MDNRYALIVNGKPVEIRPGDGFVDPEGIQHSPDWSEKWSPQYKAARGLRIIKAADPPAEGQMRVSAVLKLSDDGKEVVEVATDRPLPVANRRVDVQVAIEDAYAAEAAKGAPVGLEKRVPLDPASIERYLLIHAVASHAISAGQGGEPLGIDFPGGERMSNEVALDASFKALLFHAQLTDALKAKRRQAEAAGSVAALAAIDAASGWPQGWSAPEPSEN